MGNPSINQGVLRLMVAGVVQPDISFPLSPDNKITLGRDPNCDIPLDSYTNISRRHAEIRPLNSQAGEWVIYDLNSSNGTFINEEKIEGGQVLKAGDRIQLALDGVEFLFEHEQYNYSTNTKSQTPQLVVSERQTIKENNYRVKLLPRSLEIDVNNFLNVLLVPFVILFLAIFPGIYILHLSSVLYALYVIVIAYFYIVAWSPEIYYHFDLDKGNFTVGYQNFFGWLFGFHKKTTYSLNQFTSVGLSRSEYEGDEGNRYDDYTIIISRENGKPIKLNINWRDNHRDSLLRRKNPEKARQLLEIIEMYLKQVEE